MKAIISLFAVVLFGVVGTPAFASGFLCTSEDHLNIKLYNHVNPEDGTRNPAVLIISKDGEGTLLSRYASEIRKHNRANTVQYVVEGSRKLDADMAILQISFKEGRDTLASGIADGQLILVKDGEREVKELVCERYTKHD